MILTRRTKTIVHNEGTNIARTESNMFSKATFSLNAGTGEDKGQLDMNDPKFWDKWAVRANLNPEKLIAD